MYSSYSDYLTKILDFSEDVEGVEMKFIDKDIEKYYIKENHKRDIGKSMSFFLLVIFGYLVGITFGVLINLRVNRSIYIMITCLVIAIILFIISRFVQERYLIYRTIKYLQFFLIYLCYMWIIMFPVNDDIFSTFRAFYMFLAYMNVLFTYYLEFNYIMVLFIPLFNSILIIFLQFYHKFSNFFLLPEFLFNLLYYFAIFSIKKYEFLLNKKLFFEIYKNEQYINHIKQFIDVINTQVICLNKEVVLFMNNLANKYFDKNFQSSYSNFPSCRGKES